MFPVLYDAHHRLHNDDLPFWSRLAQRFPGPILEEGCGTGRILFELAKSQKTVIGIDLDYAMLSFLQKSTGQPPPANLSVFQADFTLFHLAEQFGLIILGCNTYSTQNADQRWRLLECARRHLQPGGAFTISVPNPALLKQLPHKARRELEEEFVHPQDGSLVQVSNEWTRHKGVLTIDWHYDHKLPNGDQERITSRVHLHLISVEQIQNEFYSAGFSDVISYGNYDEARFAEKTSSNLIMIARK